MTLCEIRNLAIIVAVVAMLSSCASMEHTGMSVGGSVRVTDNITINTNQFFKKKKD
jgi:hypothetical protein